VAGPGVPVTSKRLPCGKGKCETIRPPVWKAAVLTGGQPAALGSNEIVNPHVVGDITHVCSQSLPIR
jgi:hypothetical protein